MGELMRFWAFTCAAGCFFGSTVVLGQLIISEAMSSNGDSLTDDLGRSSDWLEVYNAGDASVSLDGFYLTDDAETPTKWKFPKTVLGAGEFLLVFASGEDRRDPGKPLHTNFKLGNREKYLALLRPDGKTVAHAWSSGLPALQRDQSCGYVFRKGRILDNQLKVFAEATPGTPNQGATVSPRLGEVRFSVSRGYFDHEFSLALKCDAPEAEIRVTFDGSEPSASNGVVYRRPIPIRTTAVVRARALAAGSAPGPIGTHSYLFVDAIARQSASPPGPKWPRGYSNGQRLRYGMHRPETVGATMDQLREALRDLPSLVVVTDPDNLFNRSRGIYVNAYQRGRRWERPVSLELIDPLEREPGFQQDAGLRIRGGYSRQGGNPKHAMRIYFRGEYGRPRLEYPLFEDEGADFFKDIDLRTAQNYSWSFERDPQNSFVREVFSRDTQRDMKQPYTRSRYYHLFLNGVYWGIYQTQEHAESNFASTYFGGSPEDYDVVKSDGQAIESTDGTLEEWRRFWALAGRIASEDDETERLALYLRAQGLDPDGSRSPRFPVYLNVSNLIDYMMVIFYTGNWDAPIPAWGGGNGNTRNWFGFRRRGGDQGFVFFAHDAEHSLGVRGSLRMDRTGPHSAGYEYQTSNPQWMHQQMMAVPAYREAFSERAQDLLLGNGLLSPGANRHRIARRVRQLNKAIIAESVRWGSSNLNRETWMNEIRRIYRYFDDRHPIVIKQLQNTRMFPGGEIWEQPVRAPLFPTVAMPQFSHSGGRVNSGFALGFRGSEGEIYYTTDGTDPRGDDGKVAASAKLASAEIVSRTTLLKEKSIVLAKVPIDGGMGLKWTHRDFDDRSWERGLGAAGFDTRGDYRSLINMDLGRKMSGRAGSAYLRFPFRVEDARRWKGLVLGLRFEDGFVAYLNGKRVAAVNAPRVPRWDSTAAGRHDDTAAVEISEFDVSTDLDVLKSGKNVLAIHLMNDDLTSSDLLASPVMEGLHVKPGKPVVLSGVMASIKARTLAVAGWSALAQAHFVMGADPANGANLAVSEIMYHPGAPTEEEISTGFEDPDAFEFIELCNISGSAIDLTDVQFTQGVRFRFVAPRALGPGERVVVVRDSRAFQKRYEGANVVVAGTWEGGLRNSGETLTLLSPTGAVIQSFSFSDSRPWPQGADGLGFSLVRKEPMATHDPAKPESWTASIRRGGDPGTSAAGEERVVVVNEVLVHTDWPQVDAIELYNPKDEPADIGGWFLSDDPAIPDKYTIPAGNVIPPGGYFVIYEDNDDNPDNNDGLDPKFFGSAFSLSSHGEEIHLFSAGKDGTQSGYSHGFKFDAAENGVSFGRLQTSDGDERFPPQRELTLGRKNSGPRSGL